MCLARGVWYRLLLNIMVDTVCNGQDATASELCHDSSLHQMSWKIVQAFADTFLAAQLMSLAECSHLN